MTTQLDSRAGKLVSLITDLPIPFKRERYDEI